MCNPRRKESRPESYFDYYHLTRTQDRISIKLFDFIPVTDSTPFISNRQDQAGEAYMYYDIQILGHSADPIARKEFLDQIAL